MQRVRLPKCSHEHNGICPGWLKVGCAWLDNNNDGVKEEEEWPAHGECGDTPEELRGEYEAVTVDASIAQI